MTYKLQIENSCGKDWRESETVKGGKFCLPRRKARCRFSAALALFLLIGTVQQSTAQVRKYQSHPSTETTAPEVKTPVKTVAKKKKSNTSKKTVYGRIRDSLSMKTIPYATVFLKGANLQVQTDSNGYFKMTIPSKLIQEKMTFVIAAEWYTNKEYILTPRELNTEKAFSIAKKDIITVEATADSRERKNKWWQLRKKK